MPSAKKPTRQRGESSAANHQQSLWEAVERGEDPSDRIADPTFGRYVASEPADVQHQATLAFARDRGAQLLRSFQAQGRGVGRSAKDGASFLLDAPPANAPVWGEGDHVLQQEGEGLMIFGPQGVGKSTVAQQHRLRRIGLRTDRLFGLPVRIEERDGVHLYLAMDRPAQIQRSFARMVNEDDRSQLKRRLVFWEGPPPISVLASPQTLSDWAQEIVAPDPLLSITVDSYKDLAPGLNSDEVGAGINSAMQEAIARGIEWVALHHPKKAQIENRIPDSLDDVYGSTWLTSGMGSVVHLGGVAGAEVITVTHLKQPMAPVGPLTIERDRASGSTRDTEPSAVIYRMLVVAGERGVTRNAAALKLRGNEEQASLKAAERLLNRMAEEGGLVVTPGTRGGASGGTPTRWRLR